MHSSMLLGNGGVFCAEPKKRPEPPLRLGSVEGSVDIKTPLLQIHDPVSHYKFIIDTGSQISVVPVSFHSSRLSPTGFLRAANGSKIHSFGKIEIAVSLNLKRVVKWHFVRATVKQAIIGLDFLRHFGLAIDLKQDKLVEPEHGDIASESCTSIDVRDNVAPEIDLKSMTTIEELCEHFASVFDLGNFNKAKPSHVVHHIHTKGPLVYVKPRRLSPEKMLILKRELKTLMDLNILSPAESEYGSPVQIIEKRKRAHIGSLEIFVS